MFSKKYSNVTVNHRCAVQRKRNERNIRQIFTGLSLSSCKACSFYFTGWSSDCFAWYCTIFVNQTFISRVSFVLCFWFKDEF